ncbi:flagellar hook-basal body protein [Domibacillus epiphyticus]|uniref:Flagellar biosynthesis protein FlgG n=1 Tax=Domibacillus epiphyticus TaxID=1714355 RepID=A0A1V2A6G6_9BACI|nr:flagellar hook-basal body protein [Domibacillus epiphyticus]OMP66603.1 flagellar biosynthesis protein FlgG [Domibacillus epiphyticus]
MNRTMINSVNTLSQLQKKMDVTSNNVANINTIGYKRSDATFADLVHQQTTNMYRQNEDIGRLTPSGIRLGVGAMMAQAQMVGAQGALQQTGRALDFALTKPNQFFKVLVQNEDGTGRVHYTRDGSFSITPAGGDNVMLVTSEGNPVLDEANNPIVMTPEEMAEQAGGLVGVVQVDKPQFLERASNNLLVLPEDPAVAEGQILRELNATEREQAGIQRGSLEQSNVDFAKEMSDLMITQRSYQFQSKAISIADQMLGLINGVR